MGKIKAKKLRDSLKENKVLRLMGAHNGISAKLAENAGFDAIWASGLEISTTYVVPDANILTMTQYLQAANEMNVATNIPIIADCDSGYGNVNNVIHLVREYERNGIAGICIEDKLFPKLNSFANGKQELEDVNKFAAKIRAAKDTQRTEDFTVIARLESLIAGEEMEKALERAFAYSEAGADMILIHSKQKDSSEIREFIERFNGEKPVAIIPTTYDMSIDVAQTLDVKVVIYANQGMRSAIHAMQETFNQIYQDGTTKYVENKIATVDEVFRLQGMFDMLERENYYNKVAIQVTR